MSHLPQRKKSAEEIAKLREEMGLPPAVAPAAEAPVPPTGSVEEMAEAAAQHPSPPISAESPEPAALAPMPVVKPVRSLKRSERQAPVEREASRVTTMAGPGAIPVQRRSEADLERMRQREAMQITRTGESPAIAYLKQMTAHPVLLALGYLLGLGSIACLVFIDPYARVKPAVWGISAAAIASLFALFIAWRFPRSRHHAAFMFMIAVVVVVFSIFQLYNNFNPPTDAP